MDIMRIFTQISRLLASLIVSTGTYGGAFAGQLDIYEHNGSVINWFVVNDEATATYATPKPSLLASGIEEGSVVFKGVEEGNRISGTAYTYRKAALRLPMKLSAISAETTSSSPVPRPCGLKAAAMSSATLSIVRTRN